MENVQLLDNLNTKNSTFGTLYITTTHLIFVSPEVRVQTASYNIVQCQCGAEGGAQTFAINGFASIKLEKNHSPFFNNPIIVIVLVKCQTNFNLGIWSNQFDALVRSKLNMK